MKETNHLSKKELSERWQVSIRSVERVVRRFGLVASEFFGRQPAFAIADVERMEKRRKRERQATLARLAHSNGVVTVRQAKRLAGKRGAK